tara:strand:+ start:254 stop:1348 length:1095 start_codon:yes stop_codon:yes gene_type:complete
MAYTTIDDPSAHFQATLYASTGNGADITVTNNGNSDLQPDWLWIKCRNGANNHDTFDSSRGITSKRLFPNLTNVEDSNGIGSVTSNGFTTGTSIGNINNTSGANTYVAWQWKMNGGTTTSGGGTDSAGTSTFQANTTAGQSIVTYTGTGSSMTVAHGLGATPKLIFIKKRTDDTEDWRVYHHLAYKEDSYGQQQSGGRLNTTNPFDHGANSYWDNTAFSSTLFTVKDNATVNDNTDTYVAYCFAEIKGYSKFGYYTANNITDGPFLYLGFKPKFMIFKKVGTTEEWFLLDTSRDVNNPVDTTLYASGAYTEGTGAQIMDWCSNGVKLRNNHTGTNGENTGEEFVYMAWAESPFVSSEGVPTTAR